MHKKVIVLEKETEYVQQQQFTLYQKINNARQILHKSNIRFGFLIH